MTNVFISYRREDTTAGFAALIHAELRRVLGADVFMDVDNLPFGVDWHEHIRTALAGCEVALVLLGSLWLQAADDAGGRRLDDPYDVLRLEIAEVLGRPAVRVIPVLFGRVKMPKPEQLPQDIRGLAAKQAFCWHLDETSTSQLVKLAEAVRLGPLTAPTQTPAPRPVATAAPQPCLGGALCARVLALCAELIDELAGDVAAYVVAEIQGTLHRPDDDGDQALADALNADAALDALDALSWTRPELAFIRDRAEELRDGGPDMHMIEVAKWYDRSSAGDIELPPDRLAELERLLTGPSHAEQLGLGADATAQDVRRAAGDRALAWRRFEARPAASPTDQRVAGDVVRFYEELALTDG